MDTVDLLIKIKNLKKQIEEKNKEVKELKRKLKIQYVMESKLLQECNELSNELAQWRPYTDEYIPSKINMKS